MKKKMPAAEFKAKCLKVMDEVAATGESVTVTKHGKQVVRVVPVPNSRERFIGRLQGTATVLGDLISPVGVAWEADAD